VVYVNTTTTVVDDRSGPVIVTPPMETGVGNHIFGTRKADVIDHNWFVPVTEFDDVIFGRKGSDTIYGLDGNDTICGDTGFAGHKKGGNDTIIGGKGDDHIWGGPGRDTFIFNTGDGDDIIRFTKKDTLDLSGTDVSSYSELKDLMSKAGDGVMIDFHNGDSVFLGKTKMSSLHSNDFDF
jgi:Ca2+-binding RTX toxin-like protein